MLFRLNVRENKVSQSTRYIKINYDDEIKYLVSLIR